MKKPSVKRGVFISSILVSSVLLTGCFGGGKEAELQAQIESLQRVNAELEAESSSGQTQAFSSSLITVEGSGVQEYVTIDNLIKFPNDNGVVDTDDDVANSFVRIGSAFAYAPSNNWEVRVDGATAHFNHPQKVWGTIKAIKVDEGAMDDPGVEQVMAGIQNFLNGQPISNQKTRKIYMSDYHTGYLVSGDMTVDKKKYVVNVGSLVYGDYGSLFLFVYEDNQTGVQQELIDLLISSGNYGDTSIMLQ